MTPDELPDDVLTSGDVALELAVLRQLVYRLADVDPDECSLGQAVDLALDRVTGLEDRLDEAEADAETAIGVANQLDAGARGDGGAPSKKDRAMHLSRDEVIKRTAEGIEAGPRNYAESRADVVGSVTTGEIRDMARPQNDLAWQTVADAWTSLAATWDCFEIDDSGDEKKLKVPDAEAVQAELARTVESSLDESGLAKRLVGGGGG